MSEELTEEQIAADLKAALDVEENLEPDAEDEGVELSAEEQEAVDKGWNPEGVEGKPNLSADEFLRNESFFKEIHKLKRELKKNGEVVQALKEHNKQTSHKAYEKAVKDLKAAKKEAAKDEDLERVIEIDEQIDGLQDAKAEADKAAPVEAPAGLSEVDFKNAYDDFTKANVWYGRKPDMTIDAEAIYDLYSRQNPNALPEDRFEHVKSEMKKAYPDDFGNQNRKRSSVSTPSKSGTPNKSKTYSLNDVDQADRAIANTLIKSGTMTESEYLADYFQK
jgi:hypothetical protein